MREVKVIVIDDEILGFKHTKNKECAENPLKSRQNKTILL